MNVDHFLLVTLRFAVLQIATKLIFLKRDMLATSLCDTRGLSLVAPKQMIQILSPGTELIASSAKLLSMLVLLPMQMEVVELRLSLESTLAMSRPKDMAYKALPFPARSHDPTLSSIFRACRQSVPRTPDGQLSLSQQLR